MKKVFTIIGLALSFGLFAQSYKTCGTTEATRKLFDQNPGLEAKVHSIENSQRSARTTGYDSTTVYIIPVVFHIVHQGGVENITDAQIQSQMDILNRDYRKKNWDTSKASTPFKNIIAECKIEFRLAQIDPQGRCTNGIERVFSTLTNSGDDNSKLSQWDPTRYLNVWTVKTIGQQGVAGYAYFPSTAQAQPQLDGVLILHDYIGAIGTSDSSHSRALTHEIGHYLNLFHTWGPNNSPEVACGDDEVLDTPPTQGHTTCSQQKPLCNAGVEENLQNYMDYSYCTVMFTDGQKLRMRTTLQSAIGSRSNLWSASNQIATGISGTVTCGPKAEFDPVFICDGKTATLNNTSMSKDAAVKYSWTLNGANNASLTSRSPQVSYANPGEYEVTLKVEDKFGADSIKKKVYVNYSSAWYMMPFSDDFETGNLGGKGWVVVDRDSDNVTWNKTAGIGKSGTSCIFVNNNNPSKVGTINSIMSPPIDFSLTTAPKLSYNLAYSPRIKASNDRFNVYYSIDCGANWKQLQSLHDTALNTSGTTTPLGMFSPRDTQWKRKSVNLSGVAGKKDVYFMFEFTNGGYGNNLYVDDINLSGTVGINEADLSARSFEVFPNPAHNSATISIDLNSKEHVFIDVYDVIGKNVLKVLENQEVQPGRLQEEIRIQQSGIYFVKVKVGEKEAVKKLIIN